jgi:Transposase Tn5 dimerisation domain/Transposase DNA-binding
MQEWIEQEFSTCDLGDRRLDDRLKTIISRISQDPSRSLSSACRGFAEVVACRRFLDNAVVSQSQLLAPHREASLERIKQHPKVLFIQDTTELDFTTKKKLKGTGPLSSPYRRGFFTHNELVVSPERLPLGLWETSIEARLDQEHGKASQRKEKPIEQKETYRWLEGYRHGCDLAQLVPGTEVIVCADREADIYEVFAERENRLASGQPAASWLIRSKTNRCLEPFEESAEEPIASPAKRTKKPPRPKIQQRLEQSPVLGTISFAVSAKEQFKKVKGGSRKKVHRSRRVATQEIRAIQVQLQAPPREDRSLPAVKIWVVQAKEINPPVGEEPIHWTLLTSLEATDFKQACAVIDLYLCRWEIEVFHRVLKTGCRVEELQLRTSPRIKLAILLYMIVAWRVLYVMHLGRQCPDLPCDVVFEDDEWQSTWVIIKGGSPPRSPPTLNEIIRMVASFGGFLGRKRDGHPGPQTLWIGLSRVQDFALCWQLTAHLRAASG